MIATMDSTIIVLVSDGTIVAVAASWVSSGVLDEFLDDKEPGGVHTTAAIRIGSFRLRCNAHRCV